MKKLMRVLVAAVCVVSMFGLAGCGNSPDKVAIKFAKCVSEADFDGASKYATKQTAALLELAKSMGKNEESEKMKGADFEVVKSEVNGDKAKVTVKTTKDGKSDEDDFTLVKEDGEWKVSIEK